MASVKTPESNELKKLPLNQKADLIADRIEVAESLLRERHGNSGVGKLSEEFIERGDLGSGSFPEDVPVKEWYIDTLALLELLLGKSDGFAKRFRRIEKENTIDDPYFLGYQFNTHVSGNILREGLKVLDKVYQYLTAQAALVNTYGVDKAETARLLREKLAVAEGSLFPKSISDSPDNPAIRDWCEETYRILLGYLGRDNAIVKRFINLGNAFPGQRNLLRESVELVNEALDEIEREAPMIGESIPNELKDGLEEFTKDHPDQLKVAFIMMQFSNTPLHGKILTSLRECLEQYGITGVRADDKEYSDNLLSNVRIYMHGCSFGISIFERIAQEEFNPNVSLEVGYMMGLKKHVCLLKDKTLRNLQTDLVGQLYKEFDPQHPSATIPPVMEKWLLDRGIIKRR